MRFHQRRHPAPAYLTLFAAVALLAPLASAPAQGQQAKDLPSLPPELLEVRAALDKYRDPIVAVHDAYFSTVGCIEYPKGGGEGAMNYPAGGMGVHFLNVALIGPTIDPRKPQVLIYEPVGNSLRLVAAEWFVPVEATAGKRPTIFGKEMEGPMEGHHPIMPTGLHHYDLHVWLWKTNPAGVFVPTNRAIKCPKRGYTFLEGPPKMAPERPR